MGRPLVSVVTVCFNAERHIAEAMGSVLAQTYPDIEYIVVDGGSTDGTPEIIRSFEQRFGDRLRWTSEPDEGIYDAMNKGIARARGELIGLLNADDAYLPDAIERVVEAYEAHPSSSAVFGDADIVNDEGRLLRTERAVVPQAHSIPARMPMCHQALFVTRRVYETLGTYDTRYAILADYEFVLRMLHAPVDLLHVPVPLVRFRTGGVCSTDMARSNAERERIRVAYGANPFVERWRRMRHAINRFVYAWLHGARSSDATSGRREEPEMIEHVTHEGATLAIIVRAAYTHDGIQFFTPDEFSQQLAFMKHPVGTHIDPHHHNPMERSVTLTQEVLFIRRGRLRVDFFDAAHGYLESRVLGPGDVVLLASGGHGFEVLEELEMFEVKQGPYAGEGEKTRFTCAFEPVVEG